MAAILAFIIEESVGRRLAVNRGAAMGNLGLAMRDQSRLKLAAEDATRAGRFVDDDLAQARQLRSEFPPEPGSHVLDGGIFKAFDLIEIRVIEPLHEWVHGTADFCVVINPANLRIDIALDGDFHFETVPMHLRAFVRGRQAGECLGSFEAEVFDDSAFHGEERGRVQGSGFNELFRSLRTNQWMQLFIVLKPVTLNLASSPTSRGIWRGR